MEFIMFASCLKVYFSVILLTSLIEFRQIIIFCYIKINWDYYIIVHFLRNYLVGQKISEEVNFN